MTYLTNGIQVLQRRWKKCEDHKENYVGKKKLHLVTFYELGL